MWLMWVFCTSASLTYPCRLIPSACVALDTKLFTTRPRVPSGLRVCGTCPHHHSAQRRQDQLSEGRTGGPGQDDKADTAQRHCRKASENAARVSAEGMLRRTQTATWLERTPLGLQKQQ